ncbi:MAG: c-type cytochrome, partial [Gemmatimonadaceae bacterium]
RGEVGPPLDGVARRAIIGGVLPNTPDNMMRWIEDPPAVAPNTAMPNLGVAPQSARDIVAYLYTLK